MHIPNIIGRTEEELIRYVEDKGFRNFHGKQIFQWVYDKFVDDFSSMTDLPTRLRESLSRDYVLRYYRPIKSLASRRRDAIKYIFRTEDGIDIENVVLADQGRRTSFCISSQIGCPVGCIYCATGLIGFIRNLRAQEIINEIVSLEKLHGKPDSILFMGMGEPLLNYREVEKAVSFLQHIGFGPRKITISTIGIPGKIRELATSGLRPRLAVSIGSPLEEKRKKIIPLAGNYPLTQLKDALKYYRRKTKRRITLEYTLIGGINDSLEEASALGEIAKELDAHVNIIRYNPLPARSREGSEPIPPGAVPADGFTPPATIPYPGVAISRASAVITSGAVPGPKRVAEFRGVLEDAGIRVTERFRRGLDIGAACGQLVYFSKSSKSRRARSDLS
jgi:23S rRNA (adenine2503-C2)-methyltransferase